MKKYIYLGFILLGFLSCSSDVENKALISTKKVKQVIINLDEELELNENRGDLRGGFTIIEGSIFINDKDEVSFNGKILDKNSPITIKIGDNDEVSFSGNQYVIKTMQLQNGDLIEMRDKHGKVFMEMEVVE